MARKRKSSRIYPNGTKFIRDAVPTPKDIASFVAPRTVEDGLSLANVFGDVGEMTPFAGAVPFVEDRLNLRNYDDDTIAIMALLGLLPFAGKITRKVNSLVPNPKGGFITLTKPVGQNKLKDVIDASNAAGQIITPEIEKEIRDQVGLVNQMKRNPTKANSKLMSNHYDRMSPEARQVVDGYLGQEQMHGFKPEGFDSWPAKDRKEYYERQLEGLGVEPEEIIAKSKERKNKNYAGRQDYGIIYSDNMTSDDYMKALQDLEAEATQSAPITMTEVQDLSTGILPSESVPSMGGRRNTYDHSRQFMDTELKQVPGIDRTGMSYGDDVDAFYDINKTWMENPSNEKKSLDQIFFEAKRKPSKRTTIATDPYYNAGIVGDKNNRLWEKINKLRAEGKTDSEIRVLLKEDLDKYQGDIERFMNRMPSKQSGSRFTYDGAATNTFNALPSEETRALKALGIDTPEYSRLERENDFYKGLTERVFNYNQRFPQSPKLSNAQFKALKDMGIPPEEIDLFLAAHPEFWQ